MKRSFFGAVVTAGLAVFVDFDVDWGAAGAVVAAAIADADEAGSVGAVSGAFVAAGGGVVAVGAGVVAAGGFAAAAGGVGGAVLLVPKITAKPRMKTKLPEATAAQMTRFFDSLFWPVVVASGAPVA